MSKVTLLKLISKERMHHAHEYTTRKLPLTTRAMNYKLTPQNFSISLKGHVRMSQRMTRNEPRELALENVKSKEDS